MKDSLIFGLHYRMQVYSYKRLLTTYWYTEPSFRYYLLLHLVKIENIACGGIKAFAYKYVECLCPFDACTACTAKLPFSNPNAKLGCFSRNVTIAPMCITNSTPITDIVVWRKENVALIFNGLKLDSLYEPANMITNSSEIIRHQN